MQTSLLPTIASYSHSQVVQGREVMENTLRQGGEAVIRQVPSRVEGRGRAKQVGHVRHEPFLATIISNVEWEASA